MEPTEAVAISLNKMVKEAVSLIEQWQVPEVEQGALFTVQA